MDPSLLQHFRQQLATWIEIRLESQRLPFQRLEICPLILTAQGPFTPDLVLWINRDSQLAGSMILLPDVMDENVLLEGSSVAKALGLGHFITWAAREVSIWSIVPGADRSHTFALPPASSVTPEDFQETLDELLEQLKVVTVTSAPSMAELGEHYFANLCLHNLQELAPGLTISARITAGQTAADEWLEQAPREKAWMSLWRILFLLWNGRLPPGLQPGKLELALRYALADLAEGPLAWLDFEDNEPPLPEEDAVRLHQLASRLRQLGWPRSDDHALALLGILLEESAQHFGMMPPLLPWDMDQVALWVSCQPPPASNGGSLVAPRAYLAGRAFKLAVDPGNAKAYYAESIQGLDSKRPLSGAIAFMTRVQSLGRKQCATRLILLRQVWPSRRFDLPHNTPEWLWDALHLVGMALEELSLTLPPDWQNAPGIMTLWAIMEERYQLAEVAVSQQGEQTLYFVRASKSINTVRVHRYNQTTEIPRDSVPKPQPGTIQVWLKANKSTLELLCSKAMTRADIDWQDQLELRPWGVFLFLQTRLGRYLWALCSNQSELPEFKTVMDAVQVHGLPLPNEIILSDLSHTSTFTPKTLPDLEFLERQFASIFGMVPDLPTDSDPPSTDKPKERRKKCSSANLIAEKVFLDGIPCFPEHYLMHLYRPEQAHYELCGPLEISESFFGRISLQTKDKQHSIEVSGKLTAEALVLASYTGSIKVSLPTDNDLLEKLLQNYRSDLKRLWDNLNRECRRAEPQRQAAIKLARRIWHQQGLPPAEIHMGA